jgi:hypothetical protein
MELAKITSKGQITILLRYAGNFVLKRGIKYFLLKKMEKSFSKTLLGLL